VDGRDPDLAEVGAANGRLAGRAGAPQAGRMMLMSSAMIAITTSSSMSVNARRP
jgi:hypothetical protein